MNAYAVALLTFRRNDGIALGHHFLEDNLALDCMHDTGKICKDTLAGSVDDVFSELGDHRQDHRLVGSTVLTCCGL
jgi:hypothetical protein